MNRKIVFKFIILIFLVFLLFGISNNIVYAEDAGNFDFEKFEGGSGNTITETADTVVGSILSVMRIVCIGIAIIMISVLGMKYIIAAPSDRAEIKKSAVQYVIGAIIMFGAAGILGLIINFTNGIFP